MTHRTTAFVSPNAGFRDFLVIELLLDEILDLHHLFGLQLLPYFPVKGLKTKVTKTEISTIKKKSMKDLIKLICLNRPFLFFQRSTKKRMKDLKLIDLKRQFFSFQRSTKNEDEGFNQIDLFTPTVPFFFQRATKTEDEGFIID